MPMDRNRAIYIVEGEIEKRFIDSMKSSQKIAQGKTYVFNLMQKQLCDNDNIMTKNQDIVYCIIDTDVADCANLCKLSSNVKKLLEIASKKIYLMPQYKNFEDELKNMTNTANIANFLNIKHNNSTEVKSYLAQRIDYSKITFDLNKYCCSFEKFIDTLNRHGCQFAKRVSITSVKCCKKK